MLRTFMLKACVLFREGNRLSYDLTEGSFCKHILSGLAFTLVGAALLAVADSSSRLIYYHNTEV